MIWKEIFNGRQGFNRMILVSIAEDSFVKSHYSDFERLIEQYPDQRFAQIVCNYICPSYRDQEPDPVEKSFMMRIFPNNPDPFYEESNKTLNRLIEGQAGNNICYY